VEKSGFQMTLPSHRATRGERKISGKARRPLSPTNFHSYTRFPFVLWLFATHLFPPIPSSVFQGTILADKIVTASLHVVHEIVFEIVISLVVIKITFLYAISVSVQMRPILLSRFGSAYRCLLLLHFRAAHWNVFRIVHIVRRDFETAFS